MKNKKQLQKICLLLVVIILSCVVLCSVDAAITINKNGGEAGVGTSQGVLGTVANTLVGVISYIGEMAASGVFATITALINILTVAMFLALQVVFVVGTSDITHIPMPDTIVFNRFAFFDPNFINPANNSLVKGFGSVLGDIFASFYTIAISVFIIAAMVTGLKMALSSIATKKAQYKEAALKWVSGFLILICLRYIIAGIFYINEVIVATLYSASVDTTIPVYVTDAIPIFGKLLTDIIKSVASIWGGNGTLIEIDGYLGICLANIAKSIGGDIIASIVGFIIMGQTLTIVGSYLKRVFMCILLGIISPLIVAADTIMTATGQQSTIFKSWLKNFAITVFMQSVHAMYMLIVLQMISLLYSRSGFVGMTSAQVGIVTIVLTTGLVKLEKMFKSLFGIGDSFAGDLKSGAKGMVKAMGAVKGITTAAKAVGDNAGKAREASRRKQAAGSQLNRLKGEQSRDNARTAYEAAKKAKSEGNMDEYFKQRQIAAEQMRAAKEHGIVIERKSDFGPNSNSNNNQNNNNFNNNPNNNQNWGNVGNNANQNVNSGGSPDYVQQVINNQNNPANMTSDQQIQYYEKEYAEAHARLKSASLATMMGPANLAAGIGLGLGMGDDISEALFTGGHITAALDKGAEVVGYRAADKDRRTFARYEAREGEKHGYTPSEKIEREKTVIEKTATNPKLYINPIEVGREIGKQLSGVGNVLADTMRDELKQMDRDLDNQ